MSVASVAKGDAPKACSGLPDNGDDDTKASLSYMHVSHHPNPIPLLHIPHESMELYSLKPRKWLLGGEDHTEQEMEEDVNPGDHSEHLISVSPLQTAVFLVRIIPRLALLVFVFPCCTGRLFKWNTDSFKCLASLRKLIRGELLPIACRVYRRSASVRPRSSYPVRIHVSLAIYWPSDKPN